MERLLSNTSKTLTVGAGKEFNTIAAAVAASHDGDTIAVSAGTYSNDFFTITDKISIVGVGGMVNLVDTQTNPTQRAAITVQNDATLTNIAVSGVTKGAAIAFLGGKLTLNNDYIHDNQTGLVGDTATSGSITINGSEFARNGDATDGNISVGSIGSLTITSSFIHDATGGNEIRSGAAETVIASNRIIQGAAASGIALVGGQAAIITGNSIKTNANASQAGFIVATPGASKTAQPSLVVTGNTVDDVGGTPLVANKSTATALLAGNSVYGAAAGKLATGSAQVAGTQTSSVEPKISTATLFPGVTVAPPPPPPPVALKVTNITTSPGTADLDAGKTILLTVTTNAAATVKGAPTLQLSDGGTASYVSGSGTTGLVFKTTVLAGQNTPDLTVTSASLNGGSITNASGSAISLPSFAVNPSGVLQIDTTPPTVTSVTASPGQGTVGVNQVVTVTLATSEATTVTGTPTLTLSDGGTAKYVSGSGTSGLTFTTTIQAGQNTPDLSVTAVNLDGGSIADAAGNAANLAGATANPTSQLVVNTNPTPPVTSTGEDAPTPPQPSQPGDIVGLVLQNPGTTALPAREITFGQEFAAGQVSVGENLVARINGQDVPVQMDVKSTNADGSVSMAVLTLEQPALASGVATGAMLAIAPTPPQSAPAVDLSTLAKSGYDLTVALNVQNANGTSTPYQINAGSLLQTALQNGTASYWLQGPQVTEVRVDAPVTGSLHVVFDISEYADGSTQTDVEFDNDNTLQSAGGTVNYSATIQQNGQTVLQQSNLTQYQYQDWDDVVYSNGAPQVNVVHDVNALEKTGAILGYDLSNPPDPTLVAQAQQQAIANPYTPLGNAGIEEFFGQTGGRPDIDPTTLWNTLWLDTQNASVATHALQQAEEAGSVPWHFYDPTTGTYVTTTDNPTLWAGDPRAGTDGTEALTQPIGYNADGNQTSGWAPDTAHEPSLSYDAYLLTGDRYDLDQLDAQATGDILETWPGTRDNGQDLVASANANQIRAAAWSLRDVVEAAYATPDSSPLKAYLTQVENNNLSYLWQQAQTSNEGQAYGYLDQQGTTLGTWQEDYLSSTLILAAEQGNQLAKQIEDWQVNFLAGRFLSGSLGLDPYDGATFYLPIANADGTQYQTWAQIEAATQAAGVASDGTSFSPAIPVNTIQASYGVMAGLITVTDSPEAIKAYGWLADHAQQDLSQASLALDPDWDIAPVLPDGQKLTGNNVIVSNDTTNVTLQGSNADQLIYAGAGNDTIIGGTGTNLLFGGTGNNVILGGSGMDFLYGGAGSDTIYGGAGTNYLDASSGPTLFELNPADAATDTIAGFRVGTDHLALLGSQSASAVFGAMSTQDTGGNTLLTFSPNHVVTLLGITVTDGATLFK